MCGFVAFLDRTGRPVSAPLLERMATTIDHRGPDGAGAWFEGGLGLAHRRLSIIDLATGHQPMADVSGERVIVFNGEIYNYVELRRELENEGARFATQSDTEVILELYRLWGEDGLSELNGMFAFALVDRPARRMLVARDPFGVKPLYWTQQPGFLAWASEIKALLAHPEMAARADATGLRDYANLQLVVDDGTLFEGVRKVLPGHFQRVDLRTGEVVDRTYWEPSWHVDPGLTEDAAVEQTRALLEDAVRLQVRSDVPLGAHLSGGTDSSIVCTLAAKHCAPPLHAFHGRFAEGKAFDESEYARSVSQRIGASLHEVVPTEREFVELMPRLMWHMDEPLAGPGLFPQYIVSREARRHVKVALGGQGGDELFAGYTRYLVAYLEQALKGAIHETNDEGEHILGLTSMVSSLPELRGYGPLLQRFWRDGLFGPMDRRYFRLIDRLEDSADLFTPEFRATLAPEAVFERFSERFNRPDTQSYLNKMLSFDLTVVLPALLHVEDRVSMAVSLESRVPMLDPRLAELTGRIPPRVKLRNGRLKHLLRQSFRDDLPAEVYHRKNKMGFPVPLHLWARGEAGDFFKDILLSERCRSRGLFDTVAIERALAGSEPFSRRLWGVLCLELWFETFSVAAARS